MRKRRTREHVIADLSANHVERHALLCGYSVERIYHDYGLDLVLHTYNRRGEIENGRVLFQLKATDRLKVSLDGSDVRCRVARGDVEYWLREPVPVILVLYHAREDVAYWLDIQAYFQEIGLSKLDRQKQSITVLIPLSQVLDQRVLRQLARRKNELVSRRRLRIHGDQ
jgi:hypothetical protein